MDDGVGIVGSTMVGSTKGLLDDTPSSVSPAQAVEYAHHKRMLNPITSVKDAENRRLIERVGEFINGDSFIAGPVNHESIKAILDF